MKFREFKNLMNYTDLERYLEYIKNEHSYDEYSLFLSDANAFLRNYPPYHKDAANIANLVRDLSQMSGTYGMGLIICKTYVKALKIWDPINWFEWLKSMGNLLYDSHTQDDSVYFTDDGVAYVYIYSNGECVSDPYCPVLPEVPKMSTDSLRDHGLLRALKTVELDYSEEALKELCKALVRSGYGS